jgi:hypothetical protein
MQMSRLQAYDPQQGYKYQLLTKYKGDRAYEHCDYAKDTQERNYLLNEYRLAYGGDFTFRVITLPMKYWKAIN